MSGITTHILDTSQGRPAAGVPVLLEAQPTAEGPSAKTEWRVIGRGVSDADGRVRDLIAVDAPLLPGSYRLTFDTAAYFVASGIDTFYPAVTVTFSVWDVAAHYHVPLLISPFGYSTYRGS